MFGLSISVGSVAVDVVPDTRGFATELKAKLKDVTANIRVDADTTALRAKLDEVTRSRTATINVNVDAAAAEAKLDAVARNRTSNFGISGIGSAIGGVFSLGGAIAALGPALIPITAAVAGLGAALVAPLAIAGGGLTIGGLIAGAAIKQTETQKKQIDELAKKVKAAKQNLANVQASASASSAISATSAQQSAQKAVANALASLHSATTPAATAAAERRLAQVRATLANSLATNQARSSLRVAGAQRKVTEATAAYDAALKGLSPAQARFLKSQQSLKDSFKNLLSTAGPAIFGPVVKGMDLLAQVLPKLAPVLKGVAGGISTLLGDMGKAASGPGFKAFMKSFGSAAHDTIVTFGRIFENVSKGLFNFFKAFAPLSKAFVGALSGAAAGFANWSKSLGSSKSFQSFLGYVKDVGPKVADTLGAVFGAFGNIAVVLAPLGSMSLGLVDGLAKLIRDIKPGELAAIATAIGAIGLAVLFATGGISGIVPAIVGLGAGITYAYNHSTKFRDIVDKIGHFFKDTLLPALRDAWQTVLPGLQSAFDSVKESVRKNHGLFKDLGEVLGAIGFVIINGVIPAMAQFYRVELPLIGKGIATGISAIALWARAWLIAIEVTLTAFGLFTVGVLNGFSLIVDAAAIGLGWIPGIGGKIKGAKKAFDAFKDGSLAAIGLTIKKVQDLQAQLDSIKPKTIRISIAVDKPPIKMIGGVPIFKPEGAGARGAIINRPTVLLAGENNKREALIPLDQTAGNSPLPSGRSGAQFEFSGDIYAQDVNDFLRQVQDRARLSSADGVPR